MTVLRQISGALGLALVLGGFVVADPILSGTLGHKTWDAFGLAEMPYRLMIVLPILAAALVWVIRHAANIGQFERLAVVSLLAASQLNGFGAGPLDVFDLVLAIVFLTWLTRLGLDTSRPVRLSPLSLATGLLMVLAFAHLPVMDAVPWFVGMIGILRVLLLSFLIIDLCRDRAMIDFAIRAFVAIAAISAAIGIAQFVLAYFQITYFTLIDPPETAFKPTPLGFIMRASGLCITAQHFSSFLVYALPLALLQLSNQRRLRDMMVCGLILLGIGVSLNFGGIFAATLVIVVFPILRYPDYLIPVALACLTVLSALYFTGVLEAIYDNSFGDAGVAKGLDQRKTLAELGIEKIASNPILGTGLRGFSEVDGNFWGRPVHNLFGQAAAELGVFGLLIMMGVFFYVTLDLAVALRRGGQDAILCGVWLSALLAALLLAQTEPNLEQSNLWMVLALAQATILLARPTAK